MVKEGEQLRSTSTGELLVEKLVKGNTAVLETVEEEKQVLTVGEGLNLNECDDECGCEFECCC